MSGAPAILATFPPEFELHAQAVSEAQPLDSAFVHPDSPAGLLWASDKSFFEKWDIQFVDPYPLGMGGFGRSSAEFAALYLLREKIRPDAGGTVFEIAWRAREEYRELIAKTNPSSVPSGADIVAQIANVGSASLVYLNFEQRLAQELSSFPFDVQFFVLPTGIKVKTHEHLAKLKNLPPKLVQALTEITENAQELLVRYDRNPIESIERTVETGELLDKYHALLASENLLYPAAMQFRDEVRALTGVLGAKGCGALGADIILVAVRTEDKSRFLFELDTLESHGCFDLRAQKWLKLAHL